MNTTNHQNSQSVWQKLELFFEFYHPVKKKHQSLDAKNNHRFRFQFRNHPPHVASPYHSNRRRLVTSSCSTPHSSFFSPASSCLTNKGGDGSVEQIEANKSEQRVKVKGGDKSGKDNESKKKDTENNQNSIVSDGLKVNVDDGGSGDNVDDGWAWQDCGTSDAIHYDAVGRTTHASHRECRVSPTVNITHFFDQRQELKITHLVNGLPGTGPGYGCGALRTHQVIVSLRDLIGSLQNAMPVKIAGGVMIIHYEVLNLNNLSIVRMSTRTKYPKSFLGIFKVHSSHLRIYRQLHDPLMMIEVHRSKTQVGRKPTFSTNVGVQKMCNGDVKRTLVLECRDSFNQNVIGSVSASLRYLKLHCHDKMSLMNRQNKQVGVLTIESCILQTRHGLPMYVRHGLSTSCLIAIDMSIHSQGSRSSLPSAPPSSPSSPLSKQIGGGDDNDVTIALDFIGSFLSSQSYPVSRIEAVGFGVRVQQSGLTCVPIGPIVDPRRPYAHMRQVPSIEAVSSDDPWHVADSMRALTSCYRQVQRTTVCGVKCHLIPVLQVATETSMALKQRISDLAINEGGGGGERPSTLFNAFNHNLGIHANHGSQCTFAGFHLLIIISTGALEDLQACITQMKQMSHLPVFVLLIGIGDLSFRKLEQFVDGNSSVHFARLASLQHQRVERAFTCIEQSILHYMTANHIHPLFIRTITQTPQHLYQGTELSTNVPPVSRVTDWTRPTPVETKCAQLAISLSPPHTNRQASYPNPQRQHNRPQPVDEVDRSRRSSPPPSFFSQSQQGYDSKDRSDWSAPPSPTSSLLNSDWDMGPKPAYQRVWDSPPSTSAMLSSAGQQQHQRSKTVDVRFRSTLAAPMVHQTSMAVSQTIVRTKPKPKPPPSIPRSRSQTTTPTPPLKIPLKPKTTHKPRPHSKSSTKPIQKPKPKPQTRAHSKSTTKPIHTPKPRPQARPYSRSTTDSQTRPPTKPTPRPKAKLRPQVKQQTRLGPKPRRAKYVVGGKVMQSSLKTRVHFSSFGGSPRTTTTRRL